VPSIGDVLNRRNDLSTFLVHLTRDHPGGPSAADNLQSILTNNTIEARSPMGWAKDAVEALGGAARDSQRTASFSETPLEQIYSMFGDIDGRDIHLRPYGVAFTKMVARQKEANPVWYVNMTPGHTWLHAAALDALRASATGSVADFIASDARRLFPFFEPMGTWPNHQREFWWEREWRVIGDFVFGRHDVALVLCPEAEIPRFTALSMGRCVDPSWSLERVVASLVGLPASAVTPFSMR
jgi:hypothetical protein